MFYCRNCGSQLTDDSKFCSKCGTPQNNLPQAPSNSNAPNNSPRSFSSSGQIHFVESAKGTTAQLPKAKKDDIIEI